MAPHVSRVRVGGISAGVLKRNPMGVGCRGGGIGFLAQHGRPRV